MLNSFDELSNVRFLIEYFQETRGLLNNETIHNNKTAPMTDVKRLPSMPVAAIPSNPKTQPPKRPPTIPTNKLTMSPKPPPLIILPAMNPATIPMTMYQIKYIRLSFRFIIIL